MRACFFRYAMMLAASVLPLASQPAPSNGGFSLTQMPSAPGQPWTGTARFAPLRYAVPVLAGAPFSAERVLEMVEVGPDGTLTEFQRSEPLYRDSAGRIRQERKLGSPDLKGAPVVAEIADPVANLAYTLDPQHKIAHRVPYPARAGAAAGVVPEGCQTAASNRPGFICQELGTQLIQGFMAQGWRWMEALPGGGQTAREFWYSDDLREMVLSKLVGPRGSRSTIKLVNISRAEPAADLFSPPADYTVVDETGPFEIHWTAERQ